MTRFDGPITVTALWILAPALILALPNPASTQNAEISVDAGDAWLEEESDPPAVRSEPADGHAWYLLGRTFHLAGDYAAAIASWRRAEALEFALPFTRYNLAAANARLGEVDVAYGWLDKALDAGFAEVDLLLIDDDLSSLRNDARFAPVVLRAFQNAEPCTGPEGKRQLDLWTRGPASVEKNSIQLASLYSTARLCRDADARHTASAARSLEE